MKGISYIQPYDIWEAVYVLCDNEEKWPGLRKIWIWAATAITFRFENEKFSREHASFHYIRVDGTSSLLEGWTRNTSAPSAFSARGNHTRLVVATGRLNFAPSQPQRISTLICVFQILPLVHHNLVGGGENLSWRQFNSWRGWTKLTKLVDSPDSLFV